MLIGSLFDSQTIGKYAYARKALALDAQKKTAEYVATLEEGLKVDPKNTTMVKNYIPRREVCIWRLQFPRP